MEKNCPLIESICGDKCPSVGYAYVPRQKVARFYDYESALVCGSIFPDLVIPKGKYGPNEDAPK